MSVISYSLAAQLPAVLSESYFIEDKLVFYLKKEEYCHSSTQFLKARVMTFSTQMDISNIQLKDFETKLFLTYFRYQDELNYYREKSR